MDQIDWILDQLDWTARALRSYFKYRGNIVVSASAWGLLVGREQMGQWEVMFMGFELDQNFTSECYVL